MSSTLVTYLMKQDVEISSSKGFDTERLNYFILGKGVHQNMPLNDKLDRCQFPRNRHF